MEDLDTLARTIYGEAEAYNSVEATAIAWVIKNRVGRAGWPYNIAEVALQPLQFSCWNSNDPNRQRILRASGTWFASCQAIADSVIKGNVGDPTTKATHYYCTSIGMPAWARGKTPCYSISHKNGTQHLFFNNVDTKAPITPGQALEQVRPLATTRTVANSQVATIATVGGMVAPAVAALTPAIPLLQTIAQYAPYVFGIVTVAAIVGIVLARIDDRNKGLR